MSNDWLNLRIWYWHLHIGPDNPWYWSFGRNEYRWVRGMRRPWIELH